MQKMWPLHEEGIELPVNYIVTVPDCVYSFDVVDGFYVVQI